MAEDFRQRSLRIADLPSPYFAQTHDTTSFASVTERVSVEPS
jgi:hypothetical protein